MKNLKNIKKITSYKIRILFLFFILLFIQNKNCLSLCEVPIQHFENNHKLPKNMLRAIALVESGRTIAPNVKVAWPWTINVDGQGYMFPSKNQAIQAVKEWMNKGKKSIDVGCMQINLKQHPDAFSNLDSAFDPHINVSYAVKFLKRLYSNSKDWLKTIGHYHSKTEKYSSVYQEKVLKTIQNISDINIADLYKNILNFNNTQNQKIIKILSSQASNKQYFPHILNASKQKHAPLISKKVSITSEKSLPIRQISNHKFISLHTRNSSIQHSKVHRFIPLNSIKASLSMRRKFLPLK